MTTRGSSIAVVIPNYNGSELLPRYLPSVCAEFGGRADIVVVDDASSDDSVGVVESRFPEVRTVRRSSNGGFSAAVNDGIAATESEFVLLLNNDVEVTPRFCEPLLRVFEDESVFAVSPRILLQGREEFDEGAKTGFWHHGLFYADQKKGVRESAPVLYTTACAAVYRRSMLAALDGFDRAYSPFYWEDADLGYRAWKRGWRSVYQPESKVSHQHGASTSRVDPGFSNRIKARNSLFFIWRNMEDASLLGNHRRWLPLVLARRAASGDLAFLRGWREAYGRRGEAELARIRDSGYRTVSDADIHRIAGIGWIS